MSLKNFLVSRVFLKNLGLAIAIATAFLLLTLLLMSIFTRHGQARPVPDFYGLSIEEADSLASRKKVRVTVIDSIFTNDVPGGCVYEQNPSAGHRVKKNRRVMLTINAFNPEMVAVPDLVGLSARQAYALIKSAGLEAGNPVYRPDLTIDFVLDQLHLGEPVAAGDSLQKGSVIVLVLGEGLSNQRIPVPDLTGQLLEDAKANILGSSLLLGTYTFDETVETEDDSLSAFVFKQNPEYSEEATIQLGSAVYIWLTLDSARLPVDSTLIQMQLREEALFNDDNYPF
jgi:beta-lactam-binding protein with PASTA domain